MADEPVYDPRTGLFERPPVQSNRDVARSVAGDAADLAREVWYWSLIGLAGRLLAGMFLGLWALLSLIGHLLWQVVTYPLRP